MLVRDFMSTSVAHVAPGTAAADALALMNRRHIRRLPVTKNNTVLGIVTRTDLVRTAPSSPGARRPTVEEVMTRNPVTVAPDVTLEEAAVLMRRHNIGALPVLAHGSLVGIITESDIFEAFISVMGLRSGGTRLTIVQKDDVTLEKIVRIIHDCQARILSFSTYRRHGAEWFVVRVDAPVPLHVVQTLVEHGINVTHLARLSGAPPDTRGETAPSQPHSGR